MPFLEAYDKLQTVFAYAAALNTNISAWNVGKVVDMRGLFYVAEDFDGGLSE